MKSIFFYFLTILVFGLGLIFNVLAENSTTTTSTPTTTISFPSFKACVGSRVRDLAKEKNQKRSNLMKNYREQIRLATSTQARKEIRKTLLSELKNINIWYANEVRKINKECLQFKKSLPTSPTSSTSM